MRFMLLSFAALGFALFAVSLHDEGDAALIEAIIGGLLVATALCAFMENKSVRKDCDADEH